MFIHSECREYVCVIKRCAHSVRMGRWGATCQTNQTPACPLREDRGGGGHGVNYASEINFSSWRCMRQRPKVGLDLRCIRQKKGPALLTDRVDRRGEE